MPFFIFKGCPSNIDAMFWAKCASRRMVCRLCGDTIEPRTMCLAMRFGKDGIEFHWCKSCSVGSLCAVLKAICCGDFKSPCAGDKFTQSMLEG